MNVIVKKVICYGKNMIKFFKEFSFLILPAMVFITCMGFATYVTITDRENSNMCRIKCDPHTSFIIDDICNCKQHDDSWEPADDDDE